MPASSCCVSPWITSTVQEHLHISQLAASVCSVRPSFPKLPNRPPVMTLQVEGEEAAGPVYIRAEDGSVLHGEASEGAWPDAQAVIAALKKAGI